MINAGKLLVFILITIVLLVVTTAFESSRMDSKSKVFGYPVVSVVSKGAKGLIAIGQFGDGVVVIAQAGRGLITFAQVSVGVIFGIGQGMGGLLTICQGGIGLLFFLGQLGLGVNALGQGCFGFRYKGQGYGNVDMEYFSELSEELGELFRFPLLKRGSG